MASLVTLWVNLINFHKGVFSFFSFYFPLIFLPPFFPACRPPSLPPSFHSFLSFFSFLIYSPRAWKPKNSYTLCIFQQVVCWESQESWLLNCQGFYKPADIMLIAWSWRTCKYLHHGNEQMIEIRAIISRDWSGKHYQHVTDFLQRWPPQNKCHFPGTSIRRISCIWFIVLPSSLYHRLSKIVFFPPRANTNRNYWKRTRYFGSLTLVVLMLISHSATVIKEKFSYIHSMFPEFCSIYFNFIFQNSRI